MKARVLFATLFLLLVTQLSWADAPDAGEISSVWDLTIAENGSIEELSSVSALPAALQSRLEREIRGWEFQPGTVEGRPVISSTSLTLRLQTTQVEGDALGVTILSAQTGARIFKTEPPVYPAAARRHWRGGLVMVLVQFDRMGNVTSVDPDRSSPVKEGALVRAAKASVKKWKIKPETVGGHPVASTFITPVCFTLYDSAGKSTGDCYLDPSKKSVPPMDGMAPARDPEVKLKTVVERKGL